MSKVGAIVDVTHHARSIAEAAIAKAKTVHGAVESQIASISARADESTMRAMQTMEDRVQALAAHSDAQTSHVVVGATQQLESEIKPLRQAWLRLLS